MDAVTLILTALTAGASAGAIDELKGEAKDKAQAAYRKLRDLVAGRFREAGTPNAEGTLADYEEHPETYGKGLAKRLAAASADQDDAILAAAQAVVDLLGRHGPQAGKYGVTITDSKGVQVGDRNTQTNTF